MLDDDLIVEVHERPAPELDDERRRYYRITKFGRAVARAEANRLSELVRLARASGFVTEEAPEWRFYRALLHLYPRSFRAEYGAEMLEGSSRANGGSSRARSRRGLCRARSPSRWRTPSACTSTSSGRT